MWKVRLWLPFYSEADGLIIDDSAVGSGEVVVMSELWAEMVEMEQRNLREIREIELNRIVMIMMRWKEEKKRLKMGESNGEERD